MTDGGVEGVVYAPEGWVYVEPLRNYLPSARPESWWSTAMRTSNPVRT